MQTNALISQKTSGGLGNLHVSDWEEGEIRAGILYLVSRYFQGSDLGSARLNKRS